MMRFEGSPQEEEMLKLMRIARERGLTIEQLCGPSLSLDGVKLNKLLGYPYRISETKTAAVIGFYSHSKSLAKV